MQILVLLSVVGVEMQQCMIRNQNELHKFSKVKKWHKHAANNKHFQATFPRQDIFCNTSLTFSKVPDISLTAVKFPDISRFSRQVVTLYTVCMLMHIDNIAAVDMHSGCDVMKVARLYQLFAVFS